MSDDRLLREADAQSRELRAQAQKAFDDRVRKLHAEGMAATEISRRLGCGTGKVESAFRRTGLKSPRPKGGKTIWRDL